MSQKKYSEPKRCRFTLCFRWLALVCAPQRRVSHLWVVQEKSLSPRQHYKEFRNKFSGCFLSLRKHSTTKDFASALFKTKATSWKHGSLKKWTVTKPFCCPACLRQYLNFEFCRPVSEACLPKETPVGGLQNKFLSTKKVKKTPVEPEGCRKEGEISWTPQGREAHQIKAEI